MSSGGLRDIHQRSFDELGRPLSDVTFCVVDLETTGGNRTDDLITEVGAVKVRGGEVLGTFQTLVNPGRAIPPQITILTGLSDALVARAPRIETVLPALLEFMGDTESGQTVIVGHNDRDSKEPSSTRWHLLAGLCVTRYRTASLGHWPTGCVWNIDPATELSTTHGPLRICCTSSSSERQAWACSASMT